MMTQKTATILVVDDDQDLLDLVGEALAIEGYEVILADNGQTALEKITQYDPNLILLDIKMPGLDGYQVLKQIRKKNVVPVIVLTGIQESSAISYSLDSGADDYIMKPFSIQELLARIKAKLRWGVQPSGRTQTGS